ncbi:DUF302 domain-containing protein [Sinorhizobium medicae]|uniref:DUF302 domain-containing protein n=1 Tax=Sinorhizobium medicae TaxID=110321 RepID=UPI000C7D5244|nr:DUF302 domain-containing protein [Sinorhizobium medicae]PLU41279.1 hypothetical protein BMJ25_32635 [Sinorhizobium medicae]RVQ40583.1 DUF302 domain-containing protein [Sinorhizobium medicae]
MTYYFAKTLSCGFDEAVRRTAEALKNAGFGIITKIDVKETLREKIDVDFRPYLILGACNPRMAYEALKIEDEVGTMLPCNVIVQDAGAGRTEVAAIDPVASMHTIDNPPLLETAKQVRSMLETVVNEL